MVSGVVSIDGASRVALLSVCRRSVSSWCFVPSGAGQPDEVHFSALHLSCLPRVSVVSYVRVRLTFHRECASQAGLLRAVERASGRRAGGDADGRAHSRQGAEERHSRERGGRADRSSVEV